MARRDTNVAEGTWWRILVVGRFMTTRWGRSDTVGDSTTRAHETDQGAELDAGQRTRRLGAAGTAPTELLAELLRLAASQRLQLAR